jgi:type II secretory pathway pseudopilin PulG
MRSSIEIAISALALILAALAFHAWLASRDDQIRLQATLAAQKQLLDAADARERDRATTLQDTLAQIDALKRVTQTPAQILRDLPKYLSLPQLITLAPADAGNPPSVPGKGITDQQGSGPSEKSGASASPASENPPDAPAARIPAADLKPLYDFVQDCRACQAQRAAAKLNAGDDATKIAALTRERDAAIKAAKGGGVWLRLRRNALWFIVGAGAGAVALCGTGHCRP